MNNTLYGAIAGDIAGSTFEFYGVPKVKTTEFFPEGSAFTDDTILTIAVADAIMSKIPFAEAIRTYGTLFPHPKGGYGNRFVSWLMNARFTGTTPPPYNSYGNGSTVRVSACAYAADTLDDVLDDFEKEYGTPSAKLDKPTHNSFQVNQERIWGCEYPFALDEEEGKVKLKTALDFGITHFIDLTEEGELVPYSPFIPQGSQVQHMRFPIKDTKVPTSMEATLALLQKMDTILSNPNAKIYLHCWEGVGRTCTIVACWIAWKQNTDFFSTLHLLDELWETCPKSSRRSAPDTQDQLDFIQSFIDYLKAK